MPKAWSTKDERQYEHVRESERQLGRSPRRAKQIAAATVNKQRTAEGRTKAQRARPERATGGTRRASRTRGRTAGTRPR
jgi:hypothetical protein